MKNICKPSAEKAFTLIELLIVVAIIAILAAIAVPNFLEAQTRAKVSRCAADMRTIRTGLESYRVDTNKYPETDYGAAVFGAQVGAGMDRLSTPIAYITSVPNSPFMEKNQGQNVDNTTQLNRHATMRTSFLYVRASVPEGTPHNGYTVTDSGPQDGIDDSYQADRRSYVLNGGASLGQVIADRGKGEWMLKSVGPDNLDCRRDPPNGFGVAARSYDPTNGTASRGDVVVFSDTQGFAGRNQ